MVAIGTLGVLVPAPQADPAAWYGKAFAIVTMATATFLTILLFIRYRARLLTAAQRERGVAVKLREVDRLKTTLMRAASHDLRTPTATILGAAETLRSLPLDEDDASALLASISRGATRLARLLDDLLDAGRVRRIVENLVMNAYRHAAGTGAVWARVRSLGDGAEIVVEDQGLGVPEADRFTIFAPFRRGDTDAPGTGLGLAIVDGFVGLHGGRVWVEDRPGGGARSTSSSRTGRGAGTRTA